MTSDSRQRIFLLILDSRCGRSRAETQFVHGESQPSDIMPEDDTERKNRSIQDSWGIDGKIKEIFLNDFLQFL